MLIKNDFCDGCLQNCMLSAAIVDNANWTITTKPTINNKILFGYYDEQDNFKFTPGCQAIVRQEKDNTNVEIALNRSKEQAIQYAKLCEKKYLDCTKRAIFVNKEISLQLHK